MSHCHQTLNLSQFVFKDKRLHDHMFFHSDTFYGQRLLSLKNNGKVHLHLIIQYEKYGLFWIQYGKILDGHMVQIKDAYWMNLLDVE